MPINFSDFIIKCVEKVYAIEALVVFGHNNEEKQTRVHRITLDSKLNQKISHQ